MKEVRRGVYTWQEIYEDWFLLGEQHEVWQGYEGEGTVAIDDKGTENPQQESAPSGEKDTMAAIFESLKNVDVQSMQKHVANLSQALGAISGVISSFQKAPEPDQQSPSKKQKPFSMKKD